MNWPNGLPSEVEVRFRVMADCAPVMVWMSGLDKLCDFFNEGWLRFTGRTMEQELGNGWAEGVHFDDLDRCLKTYVEAFDARQPFRMEYRLRRHDGAYRWILDAGTLRYGSDGSFHGYIGSCIDVTDFRDAQDRLTRSVAEKDALLKELHHRVKNNLQMIISFITLRLSKATVPETRAELKRIIERITSLALIQEQLVAAESLTEIDFAQLLLSLTASLQSMEARHDVEVKVVAEPAHLAIGKAIPLALMANELLVNSLRHAFPDGRAGRVTVTLARTAEPGGLMLSIADDGVGFPPERPRSQGFGLRIVDLLAEQAEASVSYAGQRGVNATVRLTAG